MKDTLERLFGMLDIGGDGELHRDEFHGAAQQLGWHWPEARLYAVLDRLTLDAPLSRERFAACFEQIARSGIFGEVLRAAPPPEEPVALPRAPEGYEGSEVEDLVVIFRRVATEAAEDYQRLLAARGALPLESRTAAVLIIDPQRSFTSGAWMNSMGAEGRRQVDPIRRAFEACARFLSAEGERVERMFTRCPFPPSSYDWDKRVAPLIGDAHPYFVKPDNSVLWPPTNGFHEWVTRRGIQTLVIGGCTLNSCVRVSTIDARRTFKDLRVIADLDLCGARVDNYLPSSDFGGLSSVESAVRAMEEAGVEVAASIEWSHSP